MMISQSLLQHFLRLVIASILVGSPLQASLQSAPPNAVVDLGYARYMGISNDTLSVTTYYGIQYAAPPTGARRWRSPVPIESSFGRNPSESDIINATTPSVQCVQGFPAWAGQVLTPGLDLGDLLGPTLPESEDCLRLNVNVPNSPVSLSLPVIVQIHGGGYTVGNAFMLDGTQLTSYSNGSVIYVAIQYRLGLYGFLNSQVVKANGTANVGLLDQRAALQWVQRHISAFGGDPDKVTIWGGSAGGGSVTAQMQLYGGEANPPFRAAIAEYPWWQPFHNNRILEIQYRELLQSSNCADLACLRSLSAEALANASAEVFISGYNAGNYGFGDFYVGPAVDGNIIRELPSSAFASGRFSPVPLLTDRDGYEGAIFTNFTLKSESQVLPDLNQLWQTKPIAFFTRLFQLYPLTSFTGAYFENPFFANFTSIIKTTIDNSPYWQLQTIFGDFIINCPTYYLGSAASDAGKKVYKLWFQAGNELHASTIPFFTKANSNSPNATIAAWLKSYFLGFAVDLDPNSEVGKGGAGTARPHWPTYLSRGEAGGFSVLNINTTSIGIVPDPDASEQCDFFHGQSDVVLN